MAAFIQWRKKNGFGFLKLSLPLYAEDWSAAISRLLSTGLQWQWLESQNGITIRKGDPTTLRGQNEGGHLILPHIPPARPLKRQEFGGT